MAVLLPVFRAVTTTPSIAPSAAEVTCPVRAAGPAACTGTACRNTKAALAANPSLSLDCIDFLHGNWGYQTGNCFRRAGNCPHSWPAPFGSLGSPGLIIAGL